MFTPYFGFFCLVYLTLSARNPEDQLIGLGCCFLVAIGITVKEFSTAAQRKK